MLLCCCNEYISWSTDFSCSMVYSYLKVWEVLEGHNEEMEIEVEVAHIEKQGKNEDC